MRLPLFIAMTALVLANGCGVPVAVYSDADREIRFEEYSTYNFLDPTEGNKKTIPEEELEQIRVAVARGLELRGLRFAEKDADVSVQVTVYHREAVDPYPSFYRRVYLERAVSLDMYDNRIQRHVWHGAAVRELERDPEKRMEQMPKEVAEILLTYPVGLPEVSQRL